MSPGPRVRSSEAGFTLVEMLIALVVIAVGILAVGQMFPNGSRAQVRDHLLTGANNYAQEKIEDLSVKAWADTALSAGRHPGGLAFEALGTGGQWRRFYNVTVLAAPLDNLKRVDVTVTYGGAGFDTTRSVTATTYIRQ
jgi:prepilin-type N-terminal cleavage/methylation domain-containing protein